MRKINYLNNRDILLEIHRSKISYCQFTDKKYQDYDIIVRSLDDFDEELLQQAKKNRVDRIAHQSFRDHTREGKEVKLDEFRFPVELVKDEDVVIRLMTDEHIPEDKRGPAHVQFPPFKHYAIDEDGDLFEVGRSHYKGGEFSPKHGRVTEALGKMYMTLAHKFGQRSNWRGYCVDEETEALTQRGWLKGDEINEDDTILSYDNRHMKWSKIKSIFRDNFDGLMFKLDSIGMDALVTPGHKILTERGLIEVEHLLQTDKIILMGDELETDFEPTYQDDLVELVGWIITEGNFQPKKKLVTIYQNEGEYADRIRKCLNNLNFRFSGGGNEKGNIGFLINRKDSTFLMELLPNKNLTMDFIIKLTSEQRKLLIETMINGDGWRRYGKYNSYAQKNKHHVDLYQALCAISGQKTNAHFRENHMSFGKLVNYYVINTFASSRRITNGQCINFHGGKSGRGAIGKEKKHNPNNPTYYYKGKVWCPETEYGCFVARRNGKVYLTGNSYLDEMKGQAIVQLVAAGLKFDESKSQNPFGYLTTICSNSFLGILNSEKKVQTIRDDILEENGLTPSSTRQLYNDLEILSNMKENQ